MTLGEFRVYSRVTQLYMHSHFFRCFPHVGCQEVPSGAVCAGQQVLVGYLYVAACVCSSQVPDLPLLTMAPLW